MTLRFALASLLALLGPFACDGNGSGSTTAYSTWDGEERYMYGYSASADLLSCDLYWATTGAPSNRAVCRDCLFTFDVELAYDAERSAEDGTCTELATDTTFTYGYQSSSAIDRYSGTTELSGYVGTMYEGYFVPLGPATFNQSTGAFSYRWGEGDSLYYYSGSYGYYTDLSVGTATVQ